MASADNVLQYAKKMPSSTILFLCIISIEYNQQKIWQLGNWVLNDIALLPVLHISVAFMIEDSGLHAEDRRLMTIARYRRRGILNRGGFIPTHFIAEMELSFPEYFCYLAAPW